MYKFLRNDAFFRLELGLKAWNKYIIPNYNIIMNLLIKFFPLNLFFNILNETKTSQNPVEVKIYFTKFCIPICFGY